MRRVGQPLLLGGLIRYFSQPADGAQPVSKDMAYLYAGGVIGCSGLTVLMMHPYMMSVMHTGMKLRIATCSLVYRQVSLTIIIKTLIIPN